MGNRRPVCTENPIRVYRLIESASWRDDCAGLLRSGRTELTVQVEESA
jgi:hypothetical protein